MLQALAAAPADDEESTPEETLSGREALTEYESSKAISVDELKRDLGLT